MTGLRVPTSLLDLGVPSDDSRGEGIRELAYLGVGEEDRDFLGPQKQEESCELTATSSLQKQPRSTCV